MTRYSMMTRAPYKILSLASFLVLLLATGPASSQGGNVHTVDVPRNTLKLVPAEISVKAGDSVMWTNSDTRKHNLASIPGSGPTDKLEIFSVMEPGDTYTHTFSVPGEYPYFCFIHNQMSGHITVTE